MLDLVPEVDCSGGYKLFLAGIGLALIASMTYNRAGIGVALLASMTYHRAGIGLALLASLTYHRAGIGVALLASMTYHSNYSQSMCLFGLLNLHIRLYHFMICSFDSMHIAFKNTVPLLPF